MNRRHMLKMLALIPALPLLPHLSWAKTATGAKKPSGGTPANLADPTKDSMVKAMRYVNKAAEAVKDPVSKGVYKPGSTCASCNRFNKCSTADKNCKPAAAAAKYAPCDIFSGKVVDRDGWCMSYAKK